MKREPIEAGFEGSVCPLELTDSVPFVKLHDAAEAIPNADEKSATAVAVMEKRIGAVVGIEKTKLELEVKLRSVLLSKVNSKPCRRKASQKSPKMPRLPRHHRAEKLQALRYCLIWNLRRN